MAQPLMFGQRIKFSVEGRADGKPARFTGAVAWTVDPPLLVLAPSPDGFSCVARPVLLGDCIVRATVDGVNPATFAVSILPVDATDLVISAEVMKL